MHGTSFRYPSKIQDAFRAYWGTQALTTALRLNVFSTMDLGAMAPATLAAKLGCSLRGISALLDGLLAIGLVERDSRGLYRLTEESSHFLVQGKPDYLGEARLALHGNEAERWYLLDEAVQTGQPVTAGDAEGNLTTLLEGIKVQGRLIAGQITELLDLGKTYPNGLEALDIGGGSGVYGIALAQANRKIRITQIDRPEANKLARANAEKAGVVSNFSFIDGDYHQISFGDSYYELILLSNICHIESPEANQALLARACRSLVEDGILVIHDYVLEDDRSGPGSGLLFSLNMLLHTEHGASYTDAQYREWLTKAGFDSIEMHALAGQHMLIIAER